MSEPQFKTFAFTIRPKDGVEEEHVEKTMKWCRKHALYYHVVTEKSGCQRHIHAGVILNHEKTKTNICVMLCSLLKNLSPEEKTVLRRGVKIMYNWDFIDNYCNKDDETVVIGSHLPEERHIEGYFPPKPLGANEERQRKCSAYYWELETLWFKHQSPGVEINTVIVRDFLFKMMYSLRVIPVIRDDKMIVQTACHLVRWLNRAQYNTIELPVFEKEE